MRVFGTKSTTYSAPRYSSVCPRCRPNPLTSVTVMPETPISDSAARTSSSLKGLMIAVINFILDSGRGQSGQYYYDFPGGTRHLYNTPMPRITFIEPDGVRHEIDA